MLGFPILYCKGMRPMMFQLSGFCYMRICRAHDAIMPTACTLTNIPHEHCQYHSEASPLIVHNNVGPRPYSHDSGPCIIHVHQHAPTIPLPKP